MQKWIFDLFSLLLKIPIGVSDVVDGENNSGFSTISTIEKVDVLHEKVDVLQDHRKVKFVI